MGRPIVQTVTLIAAVSNGIAASQSLPGAKGLALNLNGSLVTSGVAVLDAPRRIVITSAGNDSGLTWTVVGTGNAQATGQTAPALTESFAGGNAVAIYSTQSFATVTSITASGATASTVTAGTNGIASGPWVPWDQYAVDFQVTLVGYILSGTPSWGVEYTYDDVFGLWLPSNVTFPRPIAMASMPLSNTNSPLDGSLTVPVRASRLTVNGTGSVQLTSTQQGL